MGIASIYEPFIPLLIRTLVKPLHISLCIIHIRSFFLRCQGKCGPGCGDIDCGAWARDCLRHDICSWYVRTIMNEYELTLFLGFSPLKMVQMTQIAETLIGWLMMIIFPIEFAMVLGATICLSVLDNKLYQ